MIETLLTYPWIINILIGLYILIRLKMGVTKGFLLMLFELLSLGLSLLFAFTLLPVVTSRWTIVSIQDSGLSNAILEAITSGANHILWFFILFAIGSLLMLLLTPLVKTISKVPLLKPINQLLGGLFSLVGTWIWLFVFSLILLLPWIPSGSALVAQSWLAPVQSTTIALFEDESVLTTFENSKILLTFFTTPEHVSEDELVQLKAWLLDLGLEEVLIDQFLERSYNNNE